MKFIKQILPGIILSLLIASAAYLAGKMLPVVGGAVFGILSGIIINNLFDIKTFFLPGINFTSKKILQISIILLGSGLNLMQLYETGLSSLLVILTTMTSAFVITYFAGKFLKVDFSLKSLIGAGTAICGGSAIAAVAPVIDAKDEDVAYAISVVFLFNVIAVFTFPALGHLLDLSQQGFGMFAGTAVNDTSSVVAAGYVYGNEAGDYATIVKLTRTLMIIPVTLFFTFLADSRKRFDKISVSDKGFNIVKIFPWFIIGFVFMSGVNTSGFVNDSILNAFRMTGKFMIIMALSAIGLKTDLKKLLSTGYKPALLGFFVWMGVVITSLLVQWYGDHL